MDDLLVCPCKRKCPLVKGKSGYSCSETRCEHSSEDRQFPLVQGLPVLISDSNCDTVCSYGTRQQYVDRKLSKFVRLKRIFYGESGVTVENCRRFVEEVVRISREPRVLVIGSGELGSGTNGLWNDPRIQVDGIDVYGSDSVKVICDAHYLPIKDSSYDGVWIQAVLEHVVDPALVVSEIFRVLRPGGLVYAETPFMQQVHEGAYDFTRFTVLGHRYLFKNFEAISFGGNKGAEVVFVWSLRYLVWAITRSRKFARVVALIGGLLLRPVSFITSDRSMHDASSGVFFLGKKVTGHRLTHKDLVSLYKGQFV